MGGLYANTRRWSRLGLDNWQNKGNIASVGGFKSRLTGAFISLVSVLVLGAVGYYVIGDGRWSYFDCLYMAVITLTTVGFSEVLPGFNQVEYARPFTILMIVLGMGVVLYFFSTLTAFIIEGELRRALRDKRMQKRIKRMHNHYIVCGVGTTGAHVIRELVDIGHDVIIIDLREDAVDKLEREFPKKVPFIVGDATDDTTLDQAGVARAQGLVAALNSDKDNLLLVMSAREKNPGARIIARCVDLPIFDKLRRAGADRVVSPNLIGGLRMAAELIRPTAVKFIDQMLKENASFRIEEIDISKGSSLDGITLGDAGIRQRHDVSVLAVQRGAQFLYNPSSEEQLDASMTLIVLGAASAIEALRAVARPS